MQLELEKQARLLDLLLGVAHTAKTAYSTRLVPSEAGFMDRRWKFLSPAHFSLLEVFFYRKMSFSMQHLSVIRKMEVVCYSGAENVLRLQE